MPDFEQGVYRYMHFRMAAICRDQFLLMRGKHKPRAVGIVKIVVLIGNILYKGSVCGSSRPCHYIVGIEQPLGFFGVGVYPGDLLDYKLYVISVVKLVIGENFPLKPMSAKLGSYFYDVAFYNGEAVAILWGNFIFRKTGLPKLFHLAE